MVSTAELLVEDHAAQHGVRVETDVVPGLTANVDSDRIQSALVNLLRNAIEAAASSASPRVFLSTEADEEAITIHIEDSGPGVAADIAPRLFQPFVTGRAQGVGLGLAIAERFVRAHGGTIELAEGTLGGARFTVRLPRRAQEGA